LGVLERKVGTGLKQLTRTSLLHALNVLRRTERRRALLESTKLSGLRNDGLETQSGLDVRNVLLLGTLTLLLRSHLARKRLLLRGVPLAGGCEDVLERFLSLTIGDIARGLAALE
jgi:hypothetical protein